MNYTGVFCTALDGGAININGNPFSTETLRALSSNVGYVSSVTVKMLKLTLHTSGLYLNLLCTIKTFACEYCIYF